MKAGAFCTDGGRCRFVVWAPRHESLTLKLVAPREESHPLTRAERGYFVGELDNIGHGARYLYEFDDSTRRPDPASRFQPSGVHDPSEVIDHSMFIWSDDDWQCPALAEMIMYELHPGTFSPTADFEGIISRLEDLRDLGVNAIELMPVAAFPGSRNWGYDGVYPYAVQESYGGPTGLKRLVNAAHQTGIAVILDVVYNHLGPEGNYLHEYAPYFTEKFRSPWGWAMNFDGAGSDEVREYFIHNALSWFEDYHIDALRLDAIHGMFDMSAVPFLQELAERTDEYSARAGRRAILIAESDLNDTRVIRSRKQGGYGIPCQWSDDFHHALHTLLTGESGGYYADFGNLKDLAKAYRQAFVYDRQYSVYRGCTHGNSTDDCTAEQFVIFSQNHDQVGNRMMGDRLTTLIDFEALKLAAGAVLLGPNIPMLWMGEEYAEPAPFPYFISHGDPDLVEAVRKGRVEEFKRFDWQDTPPDPQSEETFASARLNWSLRDDGRHALMLAFYKRLIELRRTIPALSELDRDALTVDAQAGKSVLAFRRSQPDSEVVCVLNLSEQEADVASGLFSGTYQLLMDSAEPKWGGPGSTARESLKTGQSVLCAPWSVVLYHKGKK
jgi:maltooligosyltrehalose trehalohydrolase